MAPPRLEPRRLLLRARALLRLDLAPLHRLLLDRLPRLRLRARRLEARLLRQHLARVERIAELRGERDRHARVVDGQGGVAEDGDVQRRLRHREQHLAPLLAAELRHLAQVDQLIVVGVQQRAPHHAIGERLGPRVARAADGDARVTAGRVARPRQQLRQRALGLWAAADVHVQDERPRETRHGGRLASAHGGRHLRILVARLRQHGERACAAVGAHQRDA
mmetsp:Transcript_59521/g.163274  ORF Transcript_59521/g.163274 Transcript_59521/m.163274 type:complete len:221 (-) Transcript_59521:404-1066(-)